MKLIEIVKHAQNTKFVAKSKTKNATGIKLLEPFTTEALVQFESSLPCAIPAEVRELLQYCGGFDIGFGEDAIADGVFFLAGGDAPDYEGISQHSVTIARDGDGNYWMIDLTAQSTEFGPIFFASHDPPVFVFQSETLSHFLKEIFKLGNDPWTSEISEVHNKYSIEVWSKNPGILTYDQCLVGSDPDLHAFAKSLNESHLFFDLRNPSLGAGFSWGMDGADTVCKRFGDKRIFAVQKKERSWFQRLFGS